LLSDVIAWFKSRDAGYDVKQSESGDYDLFKNGKITKVSVSGPIENCSEEALTMMLVEASIIETKPKKQYKPPENTDYRNDKKSKKSKKRPNSRHR
jgi:chaperonin GroEL (HSP60 family)